MSKKYDNNLQEIKETRTFATNTTNGLSKENGIITFTQTFVTQFYNAKEQYMIDSLLKDMQENKEKYEGLMIMPIEREKIVELLNKGKEFDQLKQQLAEKDKAIELAKQKITILERALLNACTELQESNNGYVNLAGNILKPKNAMEIEYEVALSELGLIVTEEGLCDEYCGCNYDFDDTLKDQRHQICEKIRKDFDKLCEKQDNLDYICTYGLDKILDQIEKGADDE